MTTRLESLDEATVRSDGLLRFFLLAYALMWACFFIVAFTGISARGLLGSILLLTGAFAPGISATYLTARAEEKTSVKALLGLVLQWRVSAKFYVFALVYMVAIKLGAATIHRLGTGAWPRFGETPLYLIPVAIAFSTPFQAGEEVGWRGYALPRLASRFGLGRASLILGLIWGCWHLPQFFVRGADTYHQSFPVYVLQVAALSVAFAWVYARTNGSLLLTMLLHASINNSKDIVPSAVPNETGTLGFNVSLISWITLGLSWACAVYFLADMRGRVIVTSPVNARTKQPGDLQKEHRS